MVRRFVALLLSMMLCSSVAYAADLDSYVPKTWLEDGEEWLCEEHYVVDLPYTDEDFCWQCWMSYAPSLYVTGTNPIDLMSITGKAEYLGTNTNWPVFSADPQGWVTSSDPEPTSVNGYSFIFSNFSSTTTEAGTNWYHLRARFTTNTGAYLKASDFDQFYWRQGAIVNATSTGSMIFDASDGYIDFWLKYTQTAAGTANQTNVYCKPVNVLVNDNVTKIEINQFNYWHNETSATPPISGGTDEPVDNTPDWINNNYGAGVDPDISSGANEISNQVAQLHQFENDIFDGLDEYTGQVDPSVVVFPSTILGALAWVSSYFMDLYGQLGDLQFVITFPMFLGLALMFIGRMSVAINSHSMRKSRENARSDSGKVDKGATK